MRAGLWLITVLAFVVWTAGMAATAGLAQWLAAQLPQWVGGMPPATQWPWPNWLSLWLDPALLQALQSFLVWSLEVLRLIAPTLEGLGWVLVAGVWLAWGLGALALLGLALVGHVLIGRRRRHGQSHG